MPHTPHVAKHCTASESVRDIVIGAHVVRDNSSALPTDRN